MSIAQEVLRHLNEFNRKERFYVVGMALGKPHFELDEEFRQNLGYELRVSIPSDAFAAMDYHLDWIYASLALYESADAGGIYPRCNKITATQEDIDLLIAYQEGEDCHIILVEAKRDSAFSNKQLKDKSLRLKQNFGSEGRKWATVIPHFVLMSPYRPTNRLKRDKWPKWMHPDGKFKWIELQLPGQLKKVTVCDEEGKREGDGQHWMVERVPARGSIPTHRDDGGCRGIPPTLY